MSNPTTPSPVTAQVTLAVTSFNYTQNSPQSPVTCVPTVTQGTAYIQVVPNQFGNLVNLEVTAPQNTQVTTSFVLPQPWVMGDWSFTLVSIALINPPAWISLGADQLSIIDLNNQPPKPGGPTPYLYTAQFQGSCQGFAAPFPYQWDPGIESEYWVKPGGKP